MIGEHLDELIIQSDDEYEGTRKGINLPILLDGEIAGVVGITGERDEVVKYGQIIKKMTEILLIENFDKALSHPDADDLERLKQAVK